MAQIQHQVAEERLKEAAAECVASIKRLLIALKRPGDETRRLVRERGRGE